MALTILFLVLLVEGWGKKVKKSKTQLYNPKAVGHYVIAKGCVFPDREMTTVHHKLVIMLTYFALFCFSLLLSFLHKLGHHNFSRIAENKKRVIIFAS